MTQATIRFHSPNGAPDVTEWHISQIAAITRLGRMASPWAYYTGITIHAGDSCDPILWVWDSDWTDSTIGANAYARALAESWRNALEFGALLALGLDADQAESESLAGFWAESGEWESPEKARMVMAVLRNFPEWSGAQNPNIPGGENRLAIQFAHELGLDLIRAYGEESMPDVFAKINAENDADLVPGACASQRCIDSNMTMARAFVRVTGRAPDPSSQADSDWINAAWATAKRARFYRPSYPTPYGQIAIPAKESGR